MKEIWINEIAVSEKGLHNSQFTDFILFCNLLCFVTEKALIQLDILVIAFIHFFIRASMKSVEPQE